MLTLNFSPFPILKTERLVLRGVNMQDENEIFFLRADESVNKYVDRPKPLSLTDARVLLQNGRSIAKPVWGPKVTAHLTVLLANGHQFAVSDLTRLECQVGPLLSGNSVLLGKFTTFFQSPDVQVLPLTAAVCDRAAVLRAKYRFKTPDAIHLAAAIEHGCDRFLTNDVKLQRCSEIIVELLP